MDLKFSNKYVAVLLALIIVAPPLLAASYPLPGSDKQAAVICTGCAGINFLGEKNAGKPTQPFSSPIAKHVGRLVDSSSTKDIQGAASGAGGTVRANKIRVSPGATPSRVYVKMGRGIGAYTTSTFFTSTLPGGMDSVTSVGNVGVTRTKFNSPNEELTVWDAYIYAENYGTAWPAVGADDKQDVLHDFAVDDRGIIYTAYTVWGWGIHQDNGETGGALLSILASTSDSAGVITVVKAGSSYYVAVGDGATPVHKVYNVTNPNSPTLLGSRNFGIKVWGRNDTAGRIAIIDDQSQLRIYDNSTFATGGQPAFGPLSAGAGRSFSDLTFDESGNLWATEETNAYTSKVHRFTPSGSSYTQASYDVGEPFSSKAIQPNSQLISATGGYVAVAGSGLRGSDVMLFKVEGSSVRKLDLKNFFNKYYHNAPQGYANPPSDQSYVVSSYGLRLIKQANKLYLMYNAHGMGDVYELEAGDSIGGSMRTNNFGTNNPNSKGVAGPYPGDVVKFTATSSNPAVSYQVSWDFDNSASGMNIAQSATGADTSHQFAGYTTAAEITAPKKVKATVTTDASLTDTVTVNLKVPVPRIGLPGVATGITAPAASPLVLVLGDQFTDASDGTVESHVASWSIDSAPPTKLLPTAGMPVGAIGDHSVTLTTSYGRYDASTLALATSAYTPSVSNIAYVVRPFTFAINAAKSGTNAVFSGTSRVTTNTTVLTALTWTTTWTLKNGPTVIQTETATGPIGTIPAFNVPLASVPTGSTVTLDASVPTANLIGAPATYATFSQTMALSKPDPAVSRSGCANANAPCTLTASSAGGSSMDGWVYNWTLTRASDGVVVSTGTANPFQPNITAPGNYTATVVAVKGIFDGTGTNSFTTQGVLCGPPPTIDQVTMTISCGACQVGDTVTFRAGFFDYTKQDCDTLTWTFGDSSAAKTGTPVTHVYNSADTYTVRLTVSNTSGSPSTIISTTKTITNAGGGGGGGGGVDPPPCPRATNIGISYNGVSGSSTCSLGGNCKVGEAIRFTPTKNNGDVLTCETASWTFGDNSSSSTRAPSKTYNTPGTYTVTLNVNATGGASTPVTTSITINPATTGCTSAPTADNLIPEFKGPSSKCSLLNGDFCTRGEIIQFDVKAYDYTIQTCDKYEWNFGDGGTSTLKNPTHAFLGSNPEYPVTLRVYNTNNPTGITLTMQVPFDSAPIKQQPNITLSAPASAAKGVAVTFTATSDIPATGWMWTFGDGTSDNTQTGVVGTSNTVTHVFSTIGNKSVVVTAKNAEDTTDRSRNTGLGTVAVSETPIYKFLLPAVIHADGLNGSNWRTDVQVYYSAPNPSTEPLNMTAEFNGVSTPLLITQSTFIYEDFVNRLVTGEAQGPVVITTQSKYKPQIWTRTYNVDSAGRTYGQFIPAISFDANGTTASSVISADPSKYYVAGLKHDSRYRTNLGFINPTQTEVLASVIVYDDLRVPLTQFAVSMPPFQLQQFSLASKVPSIPNRPISLEISVPAGKWLVAYASLIDGASNDPVYIPAVLDSDLASTDYSTSIIPGVGHIGAWRSDVTIFNPDNAYGVTFDLEYYDSTGLLRGAARNLSLGPLQFKSYEDLLKVSNLFTPAPPDGLGMLKLKTTTPIVHNRYPMTLTRTYNDKGTGGTFGQGIAGFAAARANVKPGKGAIIPAVRSNASYKTNIGLTNTTADAVNIRVQLLDPNTGAVAKEEAYQLAAYASVVGEYPFGGLSLGTLKVEMTGGSGAVWAFASVIDRKSEDPEYVPGSPIQ